MRLEPFIKRLPFIVVFTSMHAVLMAQKPADGTYSYKLAFDEWQGRTLGATCTVIIKGDSVIVIHDGNPTLSGKKGDIINRGILMKHRFGKWIIGQEKKDINAKETGCGEGPMEIDIKRRIVLTC